MFTFYRFGFSSPDSVWSCREYHLQILSNLENMQIKIEWKQTGICIFVKVCQPKSPMVMYKTTIIANARLKTPVLPTYAFGVFISFSSGITLNKTIIDELWIIFFYLKEIIIMLYNSNAFQRKKYGSDKKWKFLDWTHLPSSIGLNWLSKNKVKNYTERNGR